MNKTKNDYLNMLMVACKSPTTKEVIRFNLGEVMDMFATAVASIGYWATIKYDPETYKKAKQDYINKYTDVINERREVCFEDVLFHIIAQGGKLTIIDEDQNRYYLTLKLFNDGIIKCIQEDYINTDDACDVDGEIADMIVQYSIFGDIVYG